MHGTAMKKKKQKRKEKKIVKHVSSCHIFCRLVSAKYIIENLLLLTLLCVTCWLFHYITWII
jgi:hypothetical protein